MRRTALVIFVCGSCTFDGTQGLIATDGGVIADAQGDAPSLSPDAMGPLRSLAAAHDVSPGIYDFRLSGVDFRSVVEADGWVLIVSGDHQTDESGYASQTEVTPACDCALTSAGLATLLEAEDLRFRAISPSSTVFETITSDSRLLDRLRQDASLVFEPSTNDVVWSGDTFLSDRLTSVTCTPGSGSQAITSKVFHACGDSDGVHWLPGNDEEAVYGSGSFSMNILVRSAPL